VNFYEVEFKLIASPHKSSCPVLMTIPCSVFEDLTSKEDFVTDILLFDRLHYIVLATNFGNIRIFKWDRKKRTKNYIHTLKGHSRAISSLMPISARRKQSRGKASFVKEETTFISAGLDGLIRVWCLERLIELYNYQLKEDAAGVDESIMRISLLNEKVFAMFTKSHKNRVDIGRISHLAQNYFISKSTIQHLEKAFMNMPCKQTNKTESLMVAFDNNSSLLLWPEDGTIRSTIYPPPTPTNISQLVYCMALNRVFLLLASGNLCIYKAHNRETATLD
jgi:WD40 repeat protein